MKKYYLKQKVFSIRDRYKVFDEEQILAYYCEAKFFSFSHQMDFFKAKDNAHIFTIKRQLFSFLPKYRLLGADGRETAVIQKKFALMKHSFDINTEMGSLKMEGNMWGYDFQVKSDAGLLLEVHKKWLSWGDTYEITIHDESKTDLLIALVLMIDDCLHDNQNSSHR